MSDARKLYKTTFTVVVLSDEPLPEECDIVEVAEASDFNVIEASTTQTQEIISAEAMRQELIDLDIHPGFFDCETEDD